jgi:hypothetical protein
VIDPDDEAMERLLNLATEIPFIEGAIYRTPVPTDDQDPL